MTNRFFYDTEFLEDGHTIELISIGIVADDGREFYAVAEEAGHGPLYERIIKHRWLMENVVPHLPLRPGNGEKAYSYVPPGISVGISYFHLDDYSNAVMPRRMIRNAVRDFLLGDRKESEITPDVQLWADYGAYDHVVLCQLFGPMVKLPGGIPMFTNDIQQAWRSRGMPPMPKQEGTEHNALADARHVKACFDHLYRLSPPGTRI